jgi:Ca2+-binding RTX toxin-like protein
VLLAVPSASRGASVDVLGAKLRVSIGAPVSGGAGNSAQVRLLPGGGAIVSLHGSVSPVDMTVGAGCQQVANGNATSIPFDFPAGGGGSPRFAATCDMTGVRAVEGRLRNSDFGAQGWLSTVDLPTSVTATSNVGNAAGQGGNRIFTGSAGDLITGSNDSDTIDAGGAPYKGQETLPPSGTPALDDANRNSVDGGGGDDTFLLTRGTGRDVVAGGTGMDLATYAGRFTIGSPGSSGVDVTLDGQANDGDPTIDQPDSTAPTEGDNVGVDVENLTGTKRDDRLIGNGLQNVLFGDEGLDTLTGGAGEDTVIAREPASAGSGTPDVISCGAPSPLRSTTTAFGVLSVSSGNDTLQADLADPKPGDCELLVDMAVAEPAPIDIANTARRARGKRLSVKLTCPRAAKRTCKGRLQLAGTRSGSGATKFSIKGGAKRTVTLRLSAKAAAAVARRRAVARLVSNEKGLKGDVNRVALVRVR